MKHKVLFFSRGRGHGHAIPDMAIADLLVSRNSNIDVRFASYSTGATTIRDAGREVIDMNLPEINSFTETLLVAHGLVGSERPSLVVAHEEFAAIAAAALHKAPVLFVSAWLPQGNTIAADTLRYANSVVIIERPGLFPIPTTVRTKIVFTGPLRRPLQFTAKDRSANRHDFGWTEDTFSIVVVPGGASKEAESPISDVVLSAFYRLPHPKKLLTWVASSEYDNISTRLAGLAAVEVIKYFRPIEKLLSAADLVITKGTRGITYDCAAVGAPSLSISHGKNSADDLIVPRVRNNIALNAAALDADVLAHYIMQERREETYGDALVIEGARALDTVVNEICLLIPRH